MLRIKIEGIPSKPEAAVLAVMALYAAAMIVFLCADAARTASLSVRRIHVLIDDELLAAYGLLLEEM